MTRNRLVHYDFIRILACLFVIAIHSTDPAIAMVGYGTIEWYFLTLIQIIVRTAVPLFIMLSGALFLNPINENILPYYMKKMIRIGIPLLVYSLIYQYEFKYGQNIFEIQTFFISIKEIIEGPVFYHLWFLYTILGIYICAPFLKIMLDNLSDKMLLNLIFVMILFSSFYAYMPLIGWHMGINNVIFINYVEYFIIGYFFTRESFVKYYYKILFLGFMALVMSFLIAAKVENHHEIIYGLSSAVLLSSSMIFAVFIKYKDIMNRMNKFITNLVSILSEYTFSIYLIHIFVLQKIIYPHGINVMNINVVIGTISTVFFTFTVSFIVAVIVDTLIIKQMIKVANRFF